MALTVKQAAAKAGVSPSQIYQWCAERRLVHYRFGGRGRRGSIRIEDSDLDAFLASCRVEPGVPLDPARLTHIRLPATGSP
jgi:excisionase family DNA binding protein